MVAKFFNLAIRYSGHSIIFSLLLSSSSVIWAKPINARCLIIQDYQKLLDGPCSFNALDQNGYFQVTGQNGIFAYAGGNPLGSYGYTNYYQGILGSKAHTPLGILTQKGACWSNKTENNKICAWAN